MLFLLANFCGPSVLLKAPTRDTAWVACCDCVVAYLWLSRIHADEADNFLHIRVSISWQAGWYGMSFAASITSMPPDGHPSSLLQLSWARRRSRPEAGVLKKFSLAGLAKLRRLRYFIADKGLVWSQPAIMDSECTIGRCTQPTNSQLVHRAWWNTLG